MKKVLSFCVFSVLLVLFCVGVKAQAPSGLQMNPANLPSPIALNQYDTVYLSPTGCFNELGLLPTDSISIEWAVLRNGDTIPAGELSRYFTEFKFQERYTVGQHTDWWGDSYVSEYCYDGNGWGSFPGAYTPTINLADGNACERDGHFNPIINRSDRMNFNTQQVGFEFDWFYVRFFTDPASGLRLVYNVKEDGDYQFVFQIWKRCNGTKWDLVTMNNDQRYYVGGHQSVRCELISSDTLHAIDTINLPDQYICVGDTLWMGNPLTPYFVTGDYTAIYHGVSSCTDALDSVVNFHLNVENPLAPILDTTNSDLIVCDGGSVTITATPQLADNCIWYNAAGDSVFTGLAYTFDVTANTSVFAVSYNTLSGCVSPDTLEVFVEVYPTTTPVVSVDTNAQCEGGIFNFELAPTTYEYFAWYHDGALVDTLNAYTFSAEAIAANAGEYYAVAADTFHHTVYDVEVGCGANSDTVAVVVYTLPTVAMTEFDGAAYAEGQTFCPSNGSHTATFAITDGTAPYTLTWTNATATHTEVDAQTFTSTINAPKSCGTAFQDTLTAIVDAHNCAWNGKIGFEFNLNDTEAPEFTLNDTVIDAAPAYDAANPCAYVLPDVHSLIDTINDNCDTILVSSVAQTPAAGTIITDSTVVTLTVTDFCGNATDTTVMVAVTYTPVTFVPEVTAEVKCAGECNAEITVTVADGHAPYDVTITKGADTYTQHGVGPFVFTGLCEGDWDIAVVDSNYCEAAPAVLNVNNPAILKMEITDSTDLLCYHDATGAFEFTANGGRFPFNVVITKDGADFASWTSNAAIDTALTGLDAATYVVTITDDSNCVVMDSVTLEEPDSLQTTSEIVINNVRCYGESNGSATVTVIGGTLPYSYAWTNLTTNASAGTDSIAINLPAATYRVVVTDAHGCQDSTELTITQPDTLEVLSVMADAANSTCPRQASYEFAAATNGGGTANYNYTWTVNGTEVQANTNVADTTDAYSHVPSIISCDTTLNIVFKVVDDHGCEASDSISFRIFDTEAPAIVGTVNDTVLYNCDSSAVPAFLTTVADIEATLGLEISDNCTADADLTVEYADVATGSCPTTVVRTYTITDQCDLSVDFSYTFTIKDTVKPTFDVPADTVLYTDSNCIYDATVAVTGNASNLADNCSTVAELEARLAYTDAVNAGTCEGETVITRTWTLEDVCGNHADTAYQTITIKDSIAPWFTTEPKNDTIYCFYDDYDFYLNEFLNYAVATDNCALDSIQKTLVDTTPGCNSASFTLNYKFTAWDKCGNSTDALASFTVKDTLKPRFTGTALNNVIVDADTICDFDHVLDSWQQAVTYEDYCVPTSEIVMTIDTLWTPACGHTGTYKLTWTIDDGCNSAQDSASFTIRDVTGPRIYPAPLDTTVNCDGAGNLEAFMTWLNQPKATDGCVGDSIEVTFKYTYNGHDEFDFDTTAFIAGDDAHLVGWQTDGSCSGFYDIIWHAVDDCGNESTTRERFRISDLEAPNFTIVPQVDTISCELYTVALRDAWAANVQAVDVCPDDTLVLGAGITRTFSFHSACSDATGRYDYEWKAMDGCGNYNTVQSSYYIIDTVAPVLVNTLGGNDVINDTLYFAQDCSVVLPANFNTRLSSLTLADYGIDHFEDCSLSDGSKLMFTVDSLLESVECRDVYRVIYTITDLCHNTASFEGKIVVLDTIAPKYVNNLDTTIYMTADCQYPSVPVFTTIMEMNATASDPQITDCNIDSTTAAVSLVPATSADTTSLTCGKQVVRTYIIKDLCDNDTTITQTITILDTLAPVVSTSVTDTVYSLSTCDVNLADTNNIYAQFADVASILAAYPELDITDCSDMTVTRGASNTEEGRCPEKIITTTFTVKDACDNESELQHTLVILDTVTPKLTVDTLVNDTIYLLDPTAGCAYTVNAQFVFDTATLADIHAWDPTFVVTDCHVDDNSLVVFKHGDTTAFGCEFEVHYFYAVFDSCGNESAEFSVTTVVLDTTRPALSALTLPDTTVYLGDPTACLAPAVAPYTKASELVAAGIDVDDCNIELTQSNVILARVDTLPTSAMACERTVVRKYVVEDSCGNISDTITHNIILKDTTGPAVAGGFNVKEVDLVEPGCTSAAVDTFETVADVNAYLTAVGGDFTYADCNIDDDCVVELVSVDSSANRCPRVVTRTYQMYDKCNNVSSNTFTQVINIKDVKEPQIAGSIDADTIYMNDYAACDYPAVDTFNSVALLPATITVEDCNLNDTVILVDADTAYTSASRPNIITITRTYEVSDSCGHTSNFTHVIYVQDTFAPIVNTDYTDDVTGFPMVKDTIVYLTELCVTPDVDYITWANHTSFAGMNSITDCQLIETITHDSTDAAMSPVPACTDTIVRYYSVKDSSNNVTVFEQRIVVKDTIAPAVTGVLPALTVYTDSTCSVAASLAALAPAYDETGIDTLVTVSDCHDWTVSAPVDEEIRDNTVCGGTANYITRSYTITDACGNDTTIEQHINIVDTIKPWLVDAPDTVAAVSAGSCTFTVPNLRELIGTAYVDNCSDTLKTFDQVPTAGTVISAPDTIEVTVTFSDSCDNEQTAVVYVTTPSSLVMDTVYADSVVCYAEANGAIHFAVSGGTEPYNYFLGATQISGPDTVDVAAGIYVVKAVDADGCEVSSPIEVLQPDTLVVAISLDNASICDYDTVTITTVLGAAPHTAGTPDYTYTWTFVDAGVATELSTAEEVNSVNFEFKHDTIAGSFQYAVSVTDHRGCVATDTVAIDIHPSYLIYDTARVCSNTDYEWVGHRTIDHSEMGSTDSTYTFYHNLTTATYGCDSIHVLILRNENTPYLTIRHIGEDQSHLTEHDLHGDVYFTGNYAANSEGYEIFVQRNCTGCEENVHVSIDYHLYRYDEDLADYVLIGNNVTDYFTPTYRTYMDMYTLAPQTIEEGYVSVPGSYESISIGGFGGNAFDYYNLCWLTPTYAGYSGIPGTSSGTFYPYGRANTIAFTQFTRPGHYKIVATLQERNGSELAQYNQTGYSQFDGKIGGHSSEITATDTVFSGITMFFEIKEGSAPVMPAVDPMEGIVMAAPASAVPSALVYPNPARDYITVELNGFEGETSIQFSNADGKVMKNQVINIPDTKSTPVVKINTSSYAQGVYMVTARTKDAIVTKRVVIVK